MLVSVSEILASTPTIKPEITTEEEAREGEIEESKRKRKRKRERKDYQ